MNYYPTHSLSMYLVTKWFGVFLCEEGKVKEHRLFDKDPLSIASKLAAIQKGEILPEERELARRGVKVTDQRLSELGRTCYFDSSFIRAEDYSYSSELMREVMLHLGKLRSREPINRDRCIIQAIRALDDLVYIINLMNERLHEWYGLYFPELSDYARDERYSELISEIGNRERIIESLGIEIESLGSDLNEEDLNIITEFARELTNLYDKKKRLEDYIANVMSDLAPNLTTLLNPNLAARLISLAGGLKRLSSLPSSTVQLLGAEKALFLHMRSGKKPPKHGIIYQHPWVHRAPPWQRGKIARTLAAKISIASKVDYWGGEFIGDRLKEEMERRIEEIQKKYPTPPSKKRSRHRR